MVLAVEHDSFEPMRLKGTRVSREKKLTLAAGSGRTQPAGPAVRPSRRWACERMLKRLGIIDDGTVLEDVRARPGIGEIRKLIEGILLMKTNVKSLVFVCGLATIGFTWGAGPARAQGFSTFSSSGAPASIRPGGFAPLAGFYRGYGYTPPPPPIAFSNPPLVLVPKVLTSYVPSYEGIQPFYGPRFAGGAIAPWSITICSDERAPIAVNEPHQLPRL